MIHILLGLWIWHGGLVSANHNVQTADLELGRKIYLKRCKVCHGLMGDGKTFAATALNPPPKNLTSEKSKKELTRKRMLESVTNGRPGTAMMPWKQVLSTGEILSVVHYIRHHLMGHEN